MLDETIQKVLWTREASPPEQILMIKMLDIFGEKEVAGTLTDLAMYLDVKRSYLVTHMKGLKDLGWIETDRQYVKSNLNLPHVAGVKIKVTL